MTGRQKGNDGPEKGRAPVSIAPEGVLADDKHVKFRIGSERTMKKRGVRVLAGKFEGDDVLECVRSKQQVKMATKDNILVMESEGKADEIEWTHRNFERWSMRSTVG
jgi:hypothetical protein